MFILAGLKDEFDAERLGNPSLEANWGLVSEWSEAKRYKVVSQDEAVDLYRAITEAKHGVFSWIQRRW